MGDFITRHSPEAKHGWRSWHARFEDGRVTLYSLFKNETLWTPFCETKATCPLSRKGFPFGRHKPLHPAESVGEDCQCGIYAALTPQQGVEELEEWQLYIDRQHKYRRRHILCERYGESSPLPILGRVSLWGEVVIHDKGFRGEFAYPQELWLPSPWWDRFESKELQEITKQLSRDYGIPVSVLTDFGSLIKSWDLILELNDSE